MVDWVRSAYTSEWSLPAAGGQVVKGRYIFAPPNAPGYPFPHYWGSRNWADGVDVLDRTFGERLSARQRWDPGTGTEDAPPATLVGDQCCRQPCMSPKLLCDKRQYIPPFLVVRASGFGVALQTCYALDETEAPFHYAWRNQGPTVFTLIDCGPNPFATAFCDVLLGLTIDLSCLTPGDGVQIFQWESPLVIIAQLGTKGGPYYPLVRVDLPTFPLNETVTTEATVYCASGAQPESTVTVTLYGSASAVAVGPVPENDGTAYYNGFPVACWGSAPAPYAAPWPFSPVDADWRRTAAELLCFQYRAPDVAAAKFAALLGPHYAISRVDNSASLVPGTLIGKSTGRTVIIISGTTNDNQIVVQGIESLQAPTSRGNYSTLPLWDQATTEIIGRLTAAGMGTSEELAIAGHSYGGAVAQLLAFRLARANPRRRISLLTFAAPPVGQVPNGGAQWPASIVTSFIVNDGDPIVFLPAPLAIVLQMAVFVPGMPITNWAQWHRPRQTTRLTINGEFISDGELTVSFADLVVITSQALAGGIVTLTDSHLMPEYVKRLWLPRSPPTVCGDPG